MANIVRNGQASRENWPLLEQAEAPAGKIDGVLVPLRAYLDRPAQYESAGVAFGVVLQATDDPAQLAPHFDRIPVIAVQFARFADGRGYSIARLLRDRHGYRGEIRAIGDVLRDQLFYMKRVGFDAFQLRDDQDVDTALAAFGDFSVRYQASADEPLPLFRRRAA